MNKIFRFLAVVLVVMISFELVPCATPVLAAEAEETCNHDWSEWEETEEPTCREKGTKTRFCFLCNEEETKSIAATGKHEWGFWEVTKEPTIKKEGRKVRECIECGKTQKKTIKKKKPFVKISKKKYSVKEGKSVTLKIKYAKGDTVKKWKTSSTSIASVNKKGKVTAKKAGTAKITVLMKSGKSATCKVTVTKPKIVKTKESKKTKKSSSGGTVYWTPNGSVYHKSRNCPSLSRSKTVYSGSISDSGKDRACKVCW